MADTHRIGALSARWIPAADRLGEARAGSRDWPARLREALAPELDALAERCGLPRETLVLVGRIDLRLERAVAEDVGMLARRACARIGEALRERLKGAEPGRPFFAEDLAVFPDAFAAESHVLTDHLSGRKPAWYAAMALAGFGGRLRPAEMMGHWLRSGSRKAVAFLEKAAASDAIRFDAMLSESQAEALMRTLGNALGSGKGPIIAKPGEWSPIDGPRPRAASRRNPEGSGSSYRHGFRLALTAANRDASGWMRTSNREEAQPDFRIEAAAELPATGISRLPAADGKNIGSPPDSRVTGAGESLIENAALPDLIGSLHKSGGLSGSASGTILLDSPGSAQAADCVQVISGGLLLLLPRIFTLPFASPLPALPAGLRLSDRQLALARRLLTEAYAGFSETWRRRAWEADRPLLAAFAGLAVEDPELDFPPLVSPAGPPVPEREEGAHVRDHLDSVAVFLRESLPDGLRAVPASRIEATPAGLPESIRPVGQGIAPASPGAPSPWRDLLLRPGILRVTRTHVDLHWPMEDADIALRRTGWDLNPGWIPALGRIYTFHYWNHK